MATSTPQQSGGSPPTSHSRGGSRPVYEDFRPNSEWKKKKEEEEEQSHEVLLVYLPGFFKEQLKVSTEGTDILRIRGESLVGVNKWRRFQEDFRIPEDCNIRGIRAKFEGETLTITMPKKKTSTSTSSIVAHELVGPKEESKRTQLGGGGAPPRPTPPPPPPPTPQPQDTKDKQQPIRYEKVVKEQGIQQQQKAQLTRDDAKRRVDDADKSSGVQFPSPQETPSSRKYQNGTTTTGGQDQDDTTTTTATTPPKIISTLISDGKLTDDRQKVLQESKLPPDQKAKDKEAAAAAAATETKSQKKEGRQDHESTPMKVAEAMTSSTGVVDKQQPDGKGVGSTSTSPSISTTSAATAAKIVQQETTEYKQQQKQQQQQKQVAVKGHLMSKERQLLMVNMGVAVLVIVALGAYVSYTLGSSSGKPKN